MELPVGRQRRVSGGAPRSARSAWSEARSWVVYGLSTLPKASSLSWVAVHSLCDDSAAACNRWVSASCSSPNRLTSGNVKPNGLPPARVPAPSLVSHALPTSGEGELGCGRGTKRTPPKDASKRGLTPQTNNPPPKIPTDTVPYRKHSTHTQTHANTPPPPLGTPRVALLTNSRPVSDQKVPRSHRLGRHQCCLPPRASKCLG